MAETAEAAARGSRRHEARTVPTGRGAGFTVPQKRPRPAQKTEQPSERTESRHKRRITVSGRPGSR